MLEYNKVMCLDYLEFLKIVPNNHVDLIIIDPPYLTTNELWDKKEVVNIDLTQELFRVLKDSGSLYVWCGIGEKSQSLIRWFPIFSKNFYFKDLITWHKQRGMGMRKGWLYTREEIMWFVKNNGLFTWKQEYQYSNIRRNNPKAFNGKPTKSENKRWSDVWDDITEESFDTSLITMQSGKRQHFTPKPKKAIARIIQLHTQESNIVLDCFSGSGTTKIVCQEMNRTFIGCDINQEYVDIANNRLK